ncbi:winged helix-turn-helix domain-containing protein [Pseudofrankia sp. BMG5.37]|uniref:winged helix-turn-helix domain-containing protein n=1 Tax=Pseudofrankia sp. BMG5.37 TaxID=3050035 RepID=UPI002894C99E|nr:winged helix-turn-helix domain-containing protein [Pseudofrankia sp. BMG5.37]MDT3439295.1 winged helix-turn-helix domain-containing protein [Pseudofrankia sp. BMG5.37]
MWYLLERYGWSCQQPTRRATERDGEAIWSQLKGTALANLAARGLDQVLHAVKHGLKQTQYRPDLIFGFLAATGLTWEGL